MIFFSQTLTVAEGGPKLRMVSACLLELCCSTWGSLSTQYSSTKSGTVHTGYDVNRRIVASASACGMGFYQVRRFFAMMGLPAPVSESTWCDLKKRIHPVIKRAANIHLQEAAAHLRAVYADTNLGMPDRDGVLDISISIDGSWQKRGRTSKNGIVTVIDTMTGLILDFVTLSNYCHECDTGPAPDDASYADFIAKHQPKCQKTIDCSSGAMEMEGAVIIFRRSIQLHGFRYSQMLGDGDAKTYARVCEDDPYDGRPIEKLECVNHVTKRMETALRNLVQNKKAQGQPIGGKGKLTDLRIKKLTNYYGGHQGQQGGSDSHARCCVGQFFAHSKHQ